jgi:hypothetical protein
MRESLTIVNAAGQVNPSSRCVKRVASLLIDTVSAASFGEGHFGQRLTYASEALADRTRIPLPNVFGEAR